MSTEIKQVIYVSEKSESFSQLEIDQMIAKSTVCNQRDEITGGILMCGNFFFQLIEGEPEKVEALFCKIEKDPRHSHVRKVYSNTSQYRDFLDWQQCLFFVDSEQHETLLSKCAQSETIPVSMGKGIKLIFRGLCSCYP